MKEKTMKKIRGSISVLMIIILLPMMTFSALIVDLSRLNMAKQMMSSAGDLTMNTALANYDTILKDVYGLFAMSQAEGMTNEALGDELTKYFAKTLSAYGVVDEKNSEEYVKNLIGDFTDILVDGKVKTTNFLELTGIDVEAQMLANSSLANPQVMRKQIVEYMKYRAPLGVGLDFLDSLKAFEKVEDQNKVVEKQVEAQEKAQPVTNACQKLIQMIREYDKRVMEINGTVAEGGDPGLATNGLLKGAANKGDTTGISLENYDSHVLKYKDAWGENYKHINKLNLIFLANSPSVDGVYLKSLDFINGTRYVAASGAFYTGSDTGINPGMPTLATNKEAAKNQVNNQRNELTTVCTKYQSMYSSKMLNSGLLIKGDDINAATIGSKNEDAIIQAFIKFEKFLLNQSGEGEITYDQVKTVLEHIQRLIKLLDNYNIYIDQEIKAAERVRDAKLEVRNSKKTTRDNIRSTMRGYVTNINKATDNYLKLFDNDLAKATEFLSEIDATHLADIQELLGDLPSVSNYETYYSSELKGSSEDKYLEQFKWLVKSSALATDGTANAVIAKESKAFLSSGRTDYKAYMDGKLTLFQQGNDFYKLLQCLYTCSTNAKNFQGKIESQKTANSEYQTAQQEYEDAQDAVEALQSEKEQMKKDVEATLKPFHTMCTNYQSDAYYYNFFIKAAKNTIFAEAQKIQTQFKELTGYLDELQKDLKAMVNQIGTETTSGTVMYYIKQYNNALDSWNSQNSTYATNNGSDTFSTQTKEDVEKAKAEFNTKLFDTLKIFLENHYKSFNTLHTKLMESTNFTYGGKRIDAISKVEDLIAASSGLTLSSVVTEEEANKFLDQLYKAQAEEYVPYTLQYNNTDSGQIVKQLQFLEPQILPLQALKYLDNTYPDPETTEKTDSDKQTVDDYEKQKDTVTEKSAESTTAASGGKGDSGKGDGGKGEGKDEGKKGDFGYTYKSHNPKGSLPSVAQKAATKTVTGGEFKLSDNSTDEKSDVNASASVKNQSSKSSSVLTGLSTALKAGIENLYILDYIFENFSYATMVQEQIVKDAKFPAQSTIALTLAAKEAQTAENISNAKAKLLTLSNFPINELNNYMFGAEIEYIMFGNTKAANNVTYTKAGIYGIRFLFNCIFAFTDSAIRNSTMAAGLAVQAATLGIVPYQIVQIVLQLALAAAESALDLSAMDCGLRVAVIKTKDTWALSMQGAGTALKDVAKAGGDVLAGELSSFASKGIKNVANGLNNLVDAGAKELGKTITDIKDNLDVAAKGVLEGIADQAMAAVMSKIEEAMNSLQNFNLTEDQTVGDVLDKLPTQAEVRAKAESLFADIKGQVDGIISDACGDNAMAKAIINPLKREINSMITNMETEVLAVIDSPEANLDIMGTIAGKVNELKLSLVEKGFDAITSMTNYISSAADEYVKSTKDELQGYIDQCSDDLSEKASEEIKKAVSGCTDKFVNTTLKVNGTSSAADMKSSPVSMFKFGYKEYLMLTLYISICVNDSAALTRVADVIQMNVQHAGGTGSDYSHPAKSTFAMSKAYTYVSITAKANLDMFFMDLDLFRDEVNKDYRNKTPATQVTDSSASDSQAPDASAPAPTTNGGTPLTYQGLLGY